VEIVVVVVIVALLAAIQVRRRHSRLQHPDRR
jgi:Tfp pilus assembly protein PilE